MVVADRESGLLVSITIHVCVIWFYKSVILEVEAPLPSRCIHVLRLLK